MTVTITKPQATLRELLAGLKKRTGLFGEQVIRAETATDFYNIIGQNRNRIINGAMTIAQRGYSTTNNSGNGYASIGTLDRWGFWCSANAGFSTAQVSDAPPGFVYSTLITTVNPITFGSTTYGTFSQRIEGNNIADLAWGTANAKPITISFWIKSSLTGTFSSYVFNDGYTYGFPFTFNIPTANTWTQITRTIAGPTAGLWQTDARVGIEFGITLMNGTGYQYPANAWVAANYTIGSPNSVNLLSTSGATMNVTGVQIERGNIATPFEHRLLGTELALCQRYYFPITLPQDTNIVYPAVVYGNTTLLMMALPVNISMRANPTVTTFIGTAYPQAYRYDGGSNVSQALTSFNVSGRNTAGVYWFELQLQGASSWGAASSHVNIGWTGGTNSKIFLSAEL